MRKQNLEGSSAYDGRRNHLGGQKGDRQPDPFLSIHVLCLFRALLSFYSYVFVVCSAVDSTLRNWQRVLAIGEESSKMPSIKPRWLRPRSRDTH